MDKHKNLIVTIAAIAIISLAVYFYTKSDTPEEVVIDTSGFDKALADQLANQTTTPPTSGDITNTTPPPVVLPKTDAELSAIAKSVYDNINHAQLTAAYKAAILALTNTELVKVNKLFNDMAYYKSPYLYQMMKTTGNLDVVARLEAVGIKS